MGKQCIFNLLCGNPGTCLGTIGVDCLVHTPFKGFTFERRQSSLGSFDSHNACFGITYRLRRRSESSFFLQVFLLSILYNVGTTFRISKHHMTTNMWNLRRKVKTTCLVCTLVPNGVLCNTPCTHTYPTCFVIHRLLLKTLYLVMIHTPPICRLQLIHTLRKN